MKCDLVDKTVYLHHESPKAVLVSITGDREHAVWLMKSAVEFYPHKGGHPDKREITLPRHIALEKELG